MIYSAKFLPVDDCWGCTGRVVPATTDFSAVELGNDSFLIQKKPASKFLLSKKLAVGLLAFGIVMLLLAYLPFFGVSVNGAQRWISIFGIQFQPSEITNVGMILLFGKLF